MTSTPTIRKTIAAFAAAFVTAGVMTWSGPAEARFGGGGMGGFYGSMSGGFHGGGFHGGGFHGGGFHGGGLRMGGFAGRPFVHFGFATNRAFFADHRFHHRRFFFGPTFALAAFGAPYYYNNCYDNDGCYVVRRRHINQWGHVVGRRELVCY